MYQHFLISALRVAVSTASAKRYCLPLQSTTVYDLILFTIRPYIKLQSKFFRKKFKEGIRNVY